jgi:hypothetical protein
MAWAAVAEIKRATERASIARTRFCGKLVEKRVEKCLRGKTVMHNGSSAAAAAAGERLADRQNNDNSIVIPCFSNLEIATDCGAKEHCKAPSHSLTV